MNSNEIYKLVTEVLDPAIDKSLQLKEDLLKGMYLTSDYFMKDMRKL